MSWASTRRHFGDAADSRYAAADAALYRAKDLSGNQVCRGRLGVAGSLAETGAA